MKPESKLIDSSLGYTSFVAEFYDHIIPYQERQDVAFFVDLAKEAGGHTLEIGCGTGRILIPTALGGNEIFGIDASDQMLSLCRRNMLTKSQAVQANVRGLFVADMRSFSLPLRFDLITIPFRSFQHLITVNEQRACLTSVHQHLKPNGTFAFDIMNPALTYLTDNQYLEEFNEEPPIYMTDGRKVVRRYRISARHYDRQFIDGEIIYYVTHPSGRVQRLVHSFPFRYTFRFEMEHLLNLCGFAVEEVFSDFDRTPFGSKYPGELIIVAKKS